MTDYNDYNENLAFDPNAINTQDTLQDKYNKLQEKYNTLKNIVIMTTAIFGQQVSAEKKLSDMLKKLVSDLEQDKG